MTTVFRSYSSSEALHSDRSSGDRQRHREKVREAIRDNVADLIAEQSIIGRSRDAIIKVPIRGIKEYRFIFGRNAAGVGQGQGDSKPGQVVGQAPKDGAAPGAAGDRPGVDYYETDITLDELIELMFEDLELPNLERKALRASIAQRSTKRKGYRRVGVQVHLDKKRTAKARIRRRVATGLAPAESAAPEAAEARFPFHANDLRFRRRSPDIDYESNAVVLCIMDTSGSMDTMKKYLARSFFFLLYQFVRIRYMQVEVVFIAHDATAREVNEDAFYHKGESGGTMISSGYAKALEIVAERYDPSLWNVYAFHCSDGDNFDNDNAEALKLARELCDVCNLFGYGEIRPDGRHWHSDSMLKLFKSLDADNFQALRLESKSDVWKSLKSFLSKERLTT
ncbi:MAG: DUF444 family protein [Dongiaceae bacterium]